MVATIPPPTAVQAVSRLTHGQLTPEGQHDIEERIRGAQKGVERMENDLYNERQRLSYLTSVLLCHHEIVQHDQNNENRFKCLRCQFIWFESAPL